MKYPVTRGDLVFARYVIATWKNHPALVSEYEIAGVERIVQFAEELVAAVAEEVDLQSDAPEHQRLKGLLKWLVPALYRRG